MYRYKISKIKDIVSNISRVEPGTWVRLVCLVISIVNLALRCLGVSTLRFSDEQVSDTVSIVFAAVSALAAYWKNNSFTSAALEADKILRGDYK